MQSNITKIITNKKSQVAVVALQWEINPTEVTGSNPVLTTKMKTSRNMEYVKTNFLSENDKLIGLSLGISKINSQVAEW